MAQNMAIVAMPKSANCKFKHLEAVALQESTALVVLVLQGAKVKQQLITFDQAVSQARLGTTASKLSAAYSGLTRPQIEVKDIQLAPMEQQLQDCILKMMQDEDEDKYEGPYFDGLHFMFSQPEFVQSQQMQNLVEMTEQRNLLRIILPEERGSQKAQVIIGKENREEAIQNYSVVIGRYGLTDEAIGNLAIVGPTRMPYARSIAAIEYLSQMLNALVARLYGKEAPPEQTQADEERQR